MVSTDPMREQLIKLAARLQKDNIKLIIGGGYGLILKSEYIRKNNLRTRFPESEVPRDRATNDIDAFLSTEIITSDAKAEKLRDALHELGFKSVTDFFQFAVKIDPEFPGKVVRIDLLSAPVSKEDEILVKINKPRIRPKNASKIHGFLTEEAVTLEKNLTSFELTEKNHAPAVFLPHPFTYLVLKLFALRDRLDDESKDRGAYHAFDIYRIIAMLTEKEWLQACEMRDLFAREMKIREARDHTQGLFGGAESIGILRLQQHAASVGSLVPEENILNMIKDLLELFPPN